jgi:hypothetical protein
MPPPSSMFPSSAHENYSDLCADRIVEINVSKLMVIVWAKVNRLVGNGPPETRIVHESTRRFPYEITEMIVAYLAHDLDALKACSLTCHSWRIATAPHAHHTILPRGDGSSVTKNWGMRLFKMYERGLMPLVKEIHVCASPRGFFILGSCPESSAATTYDTSPLSRTSRH